YRGALLLQGFRDGGILVTVNVSGPGRGENAKGEKARARPAARTPRRCAAGGGEPVLKAPLTERVKLVDHATGAGRTTATLVASLAARLATLHYTTGAHARGSRTAG